MTWIYQNYTYFILCLIKLNFQQAKPDQRLPLCQSVHLSVTPVFFLPFSVIDRHIELIFMSLSLLWQFCWTILKELFLFLTWHISWKCLYMPFLKIRIPQNFAYLLITICRITYYGIFERVIPLFKNPTF
jgi:hypothetical protein